MSYGQNVLPAKHPAGKTSYVQTKVSESPDNGKSWGWRSRAGRDRLSSPASCYRGMSSTVFLPAQLGMSSTAFLPAQLGMSSTVFLPAQLGMSSTVFLTAQLGMSSTVFLTAQLGMRSSVFLLYSVGDVVVCVLTILSWGVTASIGSKHSARGVVVYFLVTWRRMRFLYILRAINKSYLSIHSVNANWHFSIFI